MSSFRAMLEHLASCRIERLVTIRFRTTDRIAWLATPLIEKLLTDDRNGQTYRAAIAHWCRSKLPPLDFFKGNTSLCRIDGPLGPPPGGYPEYYSFPQGGLVESPGVSLSLSPEEAYELKDFIQDAIDEAIVGWIAARDETETHTSVGLAGTQQGSSAHD